MVKDINIILEKWTVFLLLPLSLYMTHRKPFKSTLHRQSRIVPPLRHTWLGNRELSIRTSVL